MFKEIEPTARSHFYMFSVLVRIFRELQATMNLYTELHLDNLL